MKLISAEILTNGKLAVDTVICQPSTSVYAMLGGALILNGTEIRSGQYYVSEENDIIQIQGENGAEFIVLRVAFDCLNGDVLPLYTALEVSDKHGFSSFVSMLGEKNLFVPESEVAAEKIAEYFVNTLVGTDDENTCGNKHVDMAKRYIDGNYFLDVKVEELAERIGVDRKYLRNLFTEYLGVSTKDYIMNLRIERAKELLSESDMPVIAVASSVGYSDALGFSKIFKKYTGLSPSDYRNSTETVDKTEEPVQETPTRAKEDIKYFLL